MSSTAILSRLLNPGARVFVTESIECDGKFALLGNTEKGSSVAIHLPARRTLLVRFMRQDPRQIEFQNLASQIRWSDELLRHANSEIARRNKPATSALEEEQQQQQHERTQHTQDTPEELAVVSKLMQKVPLRDPWATIPEPNRELFSLEYRHVEPPFLAETWPSQTITDPDELKALTRRFFHLSPDQVQLRVVTKRPSLGYFAEPEPVVELKFERKSEHMKFIAKFKPLSDPKFRAKGLRPMFVAENRSAASRTLRIDVFHSEFGAEQTYLASRGLKMYSGCKLVNPRLVDTDPDPESKDDDDTRPRFSKKPYSKTNNSLSPTVSAELEVDDIVPDSTYCQDNSTVCYYHVSCKNNREFRDSTSGLDPSKHEVESIACVLKQANSVTLVVFRPAADGFDSPELESVERLFPALKLKTVSRETEPELIQAFFNVVSSEDVDVFVALEGLSNLMPFLAKRLLFLKVDLPNCSRITGPRPRLSHVQRESIHGGDQNYDWLDIPGRCQVDLMDTARDLKLTVANPFTVLASLLRDEHKFEPGWSLMRDLYAEEYVGVRLCDLPCLQAQRLDHQVEQESIWTALFCWLAEEDKRLLLEMKQVSSISNTPLMALIFQGDFRRVLNLLYLNSFPEHQPGQPPTESRILFSHQVELLRQNWPAALDPDEQAEKKAKAKQQQRSADQDDEDEEHDQNDSHDRDRDSVRRPQPSSRRKKTVIRVKGGNVIEPIPGFDAGPLFIFDFKGLYPTIIRSDCGDLAIMVRTRAEAMFVIQYFKLKVVHQNSVVIDKLNRALFFVQDPAFPMNDKVIISSCEKLTIRREQLKTNVKQAEQDGDVHRKDLYKAQELATKKMNNGVYGVMKIIYPAFAGAITGEGRDCQEKMFQFMGGLDAEFEYEPTGVIAYGDTDSVFVKPRLLSPSLRQKIGVHDEETGVWQRHDTLEDPDTQLFDLICQSKTVRDAYFEFAAHLCKRFTSLCRPPIELECDGLMGNFLILKKKNYVGLNFKSRHDVKPKLKVQGVPSVRRDRAGITRKTFAQMSEQLCVHKNYEAVLSVFSDAIRSIKKRTVLFADLFITREITAKARKATNNITSHVCKELQQKTGKVLQDSDRLMYVAYVRDSKAKSVQFRHFSLAAQCQPDEINRTFYVDELVTVATSAFQTVFGEGVFANIAYEQTTLPGQLCKATAAPTKPKKKAKRKADRSNNQQTNRLVDAMFGKRQKADI